MQRECFGKVNLLVPQDPLRQTLRRLEPHPDNRAEFARLLNTGIATLYRKLKEYGLG
jgi:DNA-binding NtrC family response regulator